MPATKPRELRPYEATVLGVFAVLPRLTIAQVNRVLHAPSSEKYTGKVLAGIERDGYLLHGWEGGARNPNTAFVYAPALPGRRYLMGQSVVFPRAFRRQRERMANPQLVAHSLGISDVLITTARATAARPDLRVGEYRHDEYLKPVAVPILGFAPDAFVRLAVGGRPAPFAVEYDRSGTEREEVWRGKIANYLTKAEAYMDYFQARSIDVLTVVQPPRDEHIMMHATLAAMTPREREGRYREKAHRRLRELILWTGKELAARRRESWAPLFWFTIESPADRYGEAAAAYFTGPRWYRPGEASPRPFLPG
ncbi:MAG: replication-relaxation family protein [Chloroflexota bacterium]|nr:replication-relaxation family protein [Chloroflexota bacterium]